MYTEVSNLEFLTLELAQLAQWGDSKLEHLYSEMVASADKDDGYKSCMFKKAEGKPTASCLVLTLT